MPPLLDSNASPGAPTLLVLARHGQSLMNELRYYAMLLPEDADSQRVAGYNDLQIPLMPEGLRQAKALGRNLEELYGHFDVVCFSYHVRSICTKNEVLRCFSAERPPEEFQHFLFNERDNGYFFGKKKNEAERLYGVGLVKAHEEYWKRTGWFHGRPYGGESIADLAYGRTQRALDVIHKQFSRKRVLLIGHGTWIRAARVILEGHPTDTLEAPFEGLGNCEFVTYQQGEHGNLRLTYQHHTYENLP